ncbi:low molecular weight protein arginine phosphatase [Anaerolinea thermophila]|uniref:low molecular weight protein arginine phosphatase n=2 Tax=Anaerolinea TaxID=233189 RepID=UPI0026F1CF44|nr:low molecular weight protein arginine phosphatase [Anaerolinea thermophila]
MPAVLFVCTANICRSPMAAALFLARLNSNGLHPEQWLVDSAGTWAYDGQAASQNAILAMEKRGLNIRAHRSKTVSSYLLEMFDLILVMEPGHKEALQVEFPHLASRIYLLSEMAGESLPVEDPYGASLEEYEKTAAELDSLIERGLARILSLAGFDSEVSSD